MELKSSREDIAYHEAGHAAACALFSEIGVNLHMCILALENPNFQGCFVYSFNRRRNKMQQLAQAIINISGPYATAIYKNNIEAIKQGSVSDFDQFDDFLYKWSAMERVDDIAYFTKTMLHENWGLVKEIALRLNVADCMYGDEIKEIANTYKYDKEEFERLLSTIKRKRATA